MDSTCKLLAWPIDTRRLQGKQFEIQEDETMPLTQRTLRSQRSPKHLPAKTYVISQIFHDMEQRYKCRS